MDDIDKLDATLERLEAELARRLAEKIEAGEIVEVPICVAAGSEIEARIRVEEAKASALAELRAAGDQREVVFDVTMVVTGVVKHGEAPETEPWKPAPRLPTPVSTVPDGSVTVPSGTVDLRDEVAGAAPEEPPIIETYIAVQVGRCLDDDPGQIAEGWFSIDNGTVTVTNVTGKYVGSHTLLKGEDARVVAKRLLREKTPEGEEFNRRLDYPLRGWG
jgi:hypothetical protein